MKKVAIGELKPNPNNPRIIKDDKFKKLVQSIKDLPEMAEVRPIVVNTDMVVLGGNMRLKAMREAGWKDVPIQVVDWDEDKQRQFIIKDNVSGGEWDWDMLANEWDADELNEWGLDLPEFEQVQELEAEEDDFEMPDEVQTDIVLGDLFEIGEHRLLCGDSTQTDTWGKVMNGYLADMVMTDPPYNVAYIGKTKDALTIQNDKQSDEDFDQFLYDFYTALGSYTKAGGAWYVWSPPGIPETQFRNQFIASGLLLKQCLVWVKNTMVLGRQDYQWKHESCLYGWKEGAAHYFVDNRTNTTVIEDSIDPKKLTKAQLLKMVQDMMADDVKTTVLRADKPLRNDVHPTMKPILLLAPLIQNSSRIGEIVADGFLGSGSTMVAAHQLNRKCYGTELDPKYCQVIIDRMLKLDPTLEVKRNGQPYKTIE
jgi:site-specific DNA-methyltransferase (adenine-specific)